MHYDSYLRTCEIILNRYDGKIPFASWLKDFFRQDKKYGSRDRRTISHFCYVYFRLGNAFENLDIKSRIINGIFLSSQQSSGLLETFAPSLNAHIEKPVDEKLEVLDAAAEWKNIFPLYLELSSEIDHKEFAVSHLIQPDLYIRIRPGKDQVVKNKLQQNRIPFHACSAECISLPNGAPVDSVLDLDIDAVVQDRNSQEAIAVLLPFTKNKKVWDCCAASGGKSLCLFDHDKTIDLTVSDIRKSIIINLERRFKKAGLSRYRSFISDLSATGVTQEQFDIIICDAPCSGSGTWGRTPEQLKFFTADKIGQYSSIQKKIAVNAAGRLVKGGKFLYITCSVFKKENEEVVAYLEENTPLKLEQMQYLKGYDKKADSLFAALFSL
jgi:16S rRNA (cytosine967-C5)-methyltransferase